MEQAIEIIKQGGIVIFPTDTAFGIGCRLDNEQAIQKLFKLRKRPETKASPVLVSSIPMAQAYLQLIPEDVKQSLMHVYWPGGLTIVLPCLVEKVPSLARGRSATLGVRMPNHQELLTIIESVGVPVLGSSANFAGERTPFRREDIDPALVHLVDYIVPGEAGGQDASTVIDCSRKPWKILREGGVRVQYKV